MSYQNLSPETRSYFEQRAANYDGTSGEDIYNMVPEELHGSDQAIMDYMQGNPEPGVEPREVMHIEADANGGAETPDNLMLGPKSQNRAISSNNMTDADISAAEASNAADTEILMDTYGLDEAAEVTSAAIELSDSGTEVLATTAEVGGESLLETAGEALVDGLVPAIIGLQVGTYVADQFEKPIDKVGYGSAATGGVVALAFTPPGQLLVGLFCAWKVANLGYKVYKKCA